MLRFNADGSFDPTFIQHFTGALGTGTAEGIALLPDDKILVSEILESELRVQAYYVGLGVPPVYYSVYASARQLVRLNADGSPDNTFAGYGTDAAGFANSLAIDEFGHIFIPGADLPGTDPTLSRFGLVSLTPSGAIDTVASPPPPMASNPFAMA